MFIQFVFTLSYIKLWGRGEKLLRTSRYIIASVLFAIPTLFVWTVALVPDGSIERAIKFDFQQSIAGCFFPDWWKKYEGDLFPCSFLELERFINIPDTIIPLRDPPPEIVGAIIHTRDDLNPKIPCQHIGVLNLNDRRLDYSNFSNSKFGCVEMKGIQLNGSNLEVAELTSIYLAGASLRGAKLGWADLSSVNLRGANLSVAELNDADLDGADLSGAALGGTDLSEASLWRTNLSGADLSWADLSGTELNRTNLSWANMSRVDLSRSVLIGAKLIGAKLIGAKLSRADLSETNLIGVDLSVASLNRAKLYNTDLSSARMYGATLYEAQLYGTKLEGAKLFGANFSGSTLRGTSLSEVDGEKPEGWNDILDRVKRGLQESSYPDGKINVRLAVIKRSGALKPGYVLPTGTDHCVLYDEEPGRDLPAVCAEKLEDSNK